MVLFGVSEGILPHAQAVMAGTQAALEEERRIFYVGVTRAAERLLITTARDRRSRFLSELEASRFSLNRVRGWPGAEPDRARAIGSPRAGGGGERAAVTVGMERERTGNLPRQSNSEPVRGLERWRRWVERLTGGRRRR